MSKKLAKTKNRKQKAVISKNSRKILFSAALCVLVVLFLYVWGSVLITLFKFKEQKKNMVFGRDYFIEEVVITKKATDTYQSSQLSNNTNYFFYYDNDKKMRMQVPKSIYKQYDVGDKIQAYTTDHIHYDDTTDGVLPQKQFKNNELAKCIGVLLGVGICALIFRKYLYS